MSSLIDLTGKRFGLLTVLSRVKTMSGERVRWLCSCECGKNIEALGYNIKNGHTRSCGCMKSKHGHGGASAGYRSSVYTTWLSMVQRCTNTNHKHYYRYGGRGIVVCDRWNKFEYFLKDMGERPSGCTLDRIDNNKGYCRENCRWATSKEQGRNRSNNRLITHNGITQCLTAWAEDLDICAGTLRYRLDHWSVEKAMTAPSSSFAKNMVYDFYLAGGMRGYKDLNRPMFMLAAKILRKNGFTVWNPAESEDTSSLSSFADCMVLDLTAIISSCKGIILLPGWRDSLGANVEAFVSFVVGNQAYEIILDVNEKELELVPLALSQYRLPYQEGETRQFDPHQCGLNSFEPE